MITPRTNQEARDFYEVDPDPAGLAAAWIGLEHIEHHGQPLRHVGSSYAGDTVEHRFTCRHPRCPLVLVWSVTQ